MIIYNVTVSLVDQSIHQDWLKWMKEIHIPEVMDTGYFLDNKICRLLVEDEITYAIQYTCKDMDTLNEYQENALHNYKKSTTSDIEVNLGHSEHY